MEEIKKFVPVCEPALFGKEWEYVKDAVESGWISSSGKYVKKFEEEFARYCGVKHGISCCNGTTALHLAIQALRLRKGDEVIIPNFTMIASAFAVCYAGAIPVFVDADRETWNIDPAKIEEKITPKTKAIMVVHIYGNPCEMNQINEIAKKYNLKIIEDAAEAHGAEYEGKKCGSLSDVACFSFFANKIITTGEGGMVVTNDDEIAKKCRYYKNLCFPLDSPRNYTHEDIGANYRMSNLHAAIGLAQTEKIEDYVEMRIKNNSLYEKFLKGIKGIIFPVSRNNVKNVFWMNGIVVDEKEFGMNRDDLMKKLAEEGIDTRLFFNGMHKQNSLKKFGCNCEEKYPVSDWLAEKGFYLPSGSNLELETIKRICDIIKKLGKNEYIN